MKPLLFPALGLLSAALALNSLIDFQRARAIAAAELLSKPRSAKYESAGNVDSERDILSKYGSAQASSRLSDSLRLAAVREKDPDKRMHLLCEALQYSGAALSRRPRSGTLLVNWANMKQLLGDTYDCGRPFTQGDFRKSMQSAVEFEPANVGVLFSVGLLAQWAGDSQQALGMYRKALSLGDSLNSVQKDYIARQIVTGQDLLAVVPARFPQVIEWTRRLRSLRGELSQSLESSLDNLHQQALTLAEEEYSTSSIPRAMHEQRLFGLLSVGVSSQSRQKIDRLLSALFAERGSNPISEYLARRTQYSEVAVVRSFTDSDTRPARSPLVNWNHTGERFFDDFYSSVGFFVPDNYRISLIELQGRSETSSISLPLVKLFGSNDNQQWVALEGETRLESVKLGQRFVLAIYPPGDAFRYWKLNFGSSARTRTLGNELQDLIKVYSKGEAQP